MGKKPNPKAKERKAERKAMEMKNSPGVFAVKKANAQPDPLEPLPSFKKFERNGLDLVLEAKRAGSLDTGTKDWIFDLTERNMKEMYTKSEMGWNAEAKRKELTEDAAWLLIARERETEVPVAFSHFRFTLDNEDPVLYCYDLQLEECVSRKGLGKFIMKVLELVMIKNDLLKIMLIVFKHSEIGKSFFKDVLKYEIDETFTESVYEQFDYEMLSRFNAKEKKIRDEKRKQMLDDCCEPTPTRSRGGG